MHRSFLHVPCYLFLVLCYLVLVTYYLFLVKPFLLPNAKWDSAKTLLEAQGPIEIQNCLKSFCYDMPDGRQGGHLENLQLLSAPER